MGSTTESATGGVCLARFSLVCSMPSKLVATLTAAAATSRSQSSAFLRQRPEDPGELIPYLCEQRGHVRLTHPRC
ncbi:hypothetical protein AN219_17270 [Streptomyces nanshensis]|nr:hypothetical protein AN219_17270 [Streptomyces nanshensis]